MNFSFNYQKLSFQWYSVAIICEAWTRLGGCRTGVRCGPMQGAASDLSKIFFFFFFFSMDSRRLGLIYAKPGADSARIGPYRPNQVILAGGQNSRNRPTLNQAGTAEIGFGGHISHLRDTN